MLSFHNRLSDKVGAWPRLVCLISYYSRRTFRLYPTIFTSIVAGYFFYHYVYVPIEGTYTSKWMSSFFPKGVDFQELIHGLILISHNLNKFLWSLVVEVQLSILIPFLYFFLKDRRLSVFFIALLVAMVLLNLGTQLHEATKIDNKSWVIHKFIFSYVLCFFIGGICTTFSLDRMKICYDKAKYIWLVQFVIKYRIELSLFVLIFIRPTHILSPELTIWGEMIASALIIYNTYYHNEGWLAKIAAHPISRHLGLISYSLYMYSTICIYAAAMIVVSYAPRDFILQYGLITNLITTCLSIIIVVPLATVAFYIVEKTTYDDG